MRRLINKQPDIAGIMLRQWRRKHGLTTGAGRPETVGRFKNRKDFEDRIMFLWTTTEMTQTQIAEDVQCSVHAVRRVLRKVREEEERGDRKKWDWYV